MSKKEIAELNHSEVQQQPDRGIQTGESRYTDVDRDRLRALLNAGDASDADVDMLLAMAARTGLDPLLKQIYLVGRRAKTGGYRGEPVRWETRWTVQTGIDGMRAVTHRTAAKAGVVVQIEDPVFFDQHGEKHEVWLSAFGDHPEAVKVTVRVGEAMATGVATWAEYCQVTGDGTPTQMWRKFGPTMLAKCAEAQAHRKVCPDLGGVYTNEEMAQADTPMAGTSDSGSGAGGFRPAQAAVLQSFEPPALTAEQQELFDAYEMMVAQAKEPDFAQVWETIQDDTLPEHARNKLKALAHETWVPAQKEGA